MLDMKCAVPEIGVEGRDKWLHPIDNMGCNYLSLPLIPVSGIALINERQTEPDLTRLYMKRVRILNVVIVYNS